ncbi:hypothetical protein QT982_22275 [Microcoleus sp. herbarium2]
MPQTSILSLTRVSFQPNPTKKYTLAYPFYRGKHYSFSNALLRIGIKSGMGKMHDIFYTQPKLWRGWDKLGNLRQSIA